MICQGGPLKTSLLTLYFPRFSTTQGRLASLPKATVTFGMGSANLGSSVIAAKENNQLVKKVTLTLRPVKFLSVPPRSCPDKGHSIYDVYKSCISYRLYGEPGGIADEGGGRGS